MSPLAIFASVSFGLAVFAIRNSDLGAEGERIKLIANSMPDAANRKTESKRKRHRWFATWEAV